jgi:hypothetical protein
MSHRDYWRTCHLLVGALGLLLFILQGQYMARILGMDQLANGARMMYRSAHIYLMLSSLANICAGYFMTPGHNAGYLQRLVSILLLACPALLIWSFFTESASAALDRPIATYALYLLFGSGVLLLLQEGYRRLISKADD